MVPIKILAWDLETSPNLGYIWSLWNQNVSLGQLKETSEVMCFAARWIDEPTSSIIFKSTHADGVDGMRQAAWDLLDEADALLSWNGKGFDTKHMQREFLLADLGPTSPFVEIDMLKTARNKFKFVSNKLEHVANQLGLGGKVKHSGFDLWLRCMAGNTEAWAEMERYNKQDVNLLVEIYERFLPWISGHPNQNLYSDGELVCTRCKSTNHTKEGWRPTQLGWYQRHKCHDCKGYFSSGKAIERVDLRSI